jgi:fatty-acyl-CoA synthase
VTAAARECAAQLSLPELLRRNATRMPSAPALRMDGRTISYGDLELRAGRLAAALRERGVRPADRVSIWMHNSIEMVEVLFAIHKLGAAAVPLNFRLRPDETAFILSDVGSGGLIADDALLHSGGTALDLEWTLSVSADSDSPYEEAITRAGTPVESEVVDDDSPAFVMYTSGTTGRPKGAVLTHKNLVSNTWSWAFEVGVARGDTYTAGLPLFHIGGLVGLYPFLLLGESVVIQRSGGFDAEATLDLMDRSETTICAYVPAQWQLLVELPDAAKKLARYRRAIWGASPASRPLLEQMTETLPDGSIVSTFGQTEVTANATFLGPADALRKLGSVGRPAATMECRIVDEEDRDVAQGEVGEIVYRGPTVMREYVNRPEATEEAFRGGWFHGGDVVRQDEEGYIYVVDRKNDLIISGGENIYPAEVERVMVEHPAIGEIAVVGTPHARWGETPVAFVVQAPGAQARADDLIAFCRDRLAGYKRPSRVIFIEELPRNASGKVLKRDLRELVPNENGER